MDKSRRKSTNGSVSRHPDSGSDDSDVFDMTTDTRKKPNGLERLMSVDSAIVPPTKEKKQKQSFLKLRSQKKKPKTEKTSNTTSYSSGGSNAGSGTYPRKVYVDMRAFNSSGRASVGRASVGGASIGRASVGGASVGGASVGGVSLGGFSLGGDSLHGGSSLSSAADMKYYWTDSDEREPVVPIIPPWMHDNTEVSGDEGWGVCVWGERECECWWKCVWLCWEQP